MMKWFLDLTTRAKLFLGFGLMVVLLAAVTVTAYTGITALEQSQKRLYDEAFTNTTDLLTVRTNLNGVRAALVTMLSVTARSDQDLWQQDVRDRSRQVDETLRRVLDRQRSDPGSIRTLEELRATWEAFKQMRDTQIVSLFSQGKVEEARKLATVGIQTERYVRMRSIAQQLGESAETSARTAVSQSAQRASDSVRLFLVIGVIALVVSLVMVGSLNRAIAAPLRHLSGVAERVASGDLTVTVASSDNRADEVGVLAQTFRRMVENLRDVNRQIRDGVNVLGSAASEILAATTQVAAAATETAAAVSETTTTVEEVKQTSQVSSQKARYVSDSAQKTAQVSQAGKKAMDDAVEGMMRIREQMESIAGSIVRLSEQSQAIGEIIASVNDLAEQSNLLAVNAAIEAAKAGEQGRGFAVVAQEVKSLAEQSKQATAQVRAILTDIQKATSTAVMATEQGSKAVAAGVKRSTEAGESIRILTESIAEATQAAAQIAASSQQQLVGMDQMALAMENIKQASTQNVAGTKQTETAAQNLHDLGQKLKQIVERYTV
jgi:methyl-accepting chemotaxis protein